MRSEGVLRLILNISLFKGMKINLEQDKFLRIVALEDGRLVHFAIKVSQEGKEVDILVLKGLKHLLLSLPTI